MEAANRAQNRLQAQELPFEDVSYEIAGIRINSFEKPVDPDAESVTYRAESAPIVYGDMEVRIVVVGTATSNHYEIVDGYDYVTGDYTQERVFACSDVYDTIVPNAAILVTVNGITSTTTTDGYREAILSLPITTAAVARRADLPLLWGHGVADLADRVWYSVEHCKGELHDGGLVELFTFIPHEYDELPSAI